MIDLVLWPLDIIFSATHESLKIYKKAIQIPKLVKLQGTKPKENFLLEYFINGTIPD